MKKLIIFILLNFAAVISTYSQFSADADGSLNVGEIDGSLTYSYPISNATVDGFPLKVDLNYVGNLAFMDYNYYINQLYYPNEGWLQFLRFHPAWVMSVNGFAINVLGHKSRFSSGGMSWEYGYDLGQNLFDNVAASYSIYKRECEYNWVIEGYDFNNTMTSPAKAGYQDKIKILMGNGSILELRNGSVTQDTSEFNNPATYTGYYFDNAVNSNIYGLVSYDTTQNWFNYIKTKYGKDIQYGENNAYRKPRILKIYTGDGLEYVFREYIAPFGMREFLLHQNTNGGKFYPMPTVFYLEEMNSSMGKITSFERAWHNFPANQDTMIYRGRAPITKFANHEISFSEGKIDIKVFNKTIELVVGEKPIGDVPYWNDRLYPKYSLRFINNEDSAKTFYDNIFKQVPRLPGPFYENYPFYLKDYEVPPSDAITTYFILKNNICEEINQKCVTNMTGNFGTETNLPNGVEQFGNNILLVKEIIDPQLRRTKFTYSSHMVAVNNQPFDTLNVFPLVYKANSYLHRYELTKIEEPSKVVTISYLDGNHLVKSSDLSNANFDVDYKQFVSILNFYDKKMDGTANQLIKYMSYSYTGDIGQGFWRSTTITTTDLSISNSASLVTNWYQFEKREVDQVLGGGSNKRDYIFPKLSGQIINGNDVTITRTNVMRLDSITNNPDHSQYFFETETKTYHGFNDVNKTCDNNPDSMIAYKKYEYEFEKINDFALNRFKTIAEGDTVRRLLGWGVSKFTIKNYQPANPTSLLSQGETYLLNLPTKYSISVNRTESITNYDNALINRINLIHYGRVNLQDYIDNGWVTHESEVSSQVVQKDVNLPAIWGLTQKTIIKDRNGNIIGGEINNYDEADRTEDDPPNRRGALLSDSVISINGNHVKVNKIYTYTNTGYRNFLSTTENILGVKTQNYYSYYKNATTDSTAKILYDDESVTDHYFANTVPQYEAPIGDAVWVRKGSSTFSGGVFTYQIDNLKLSQLYEKSDYGMVIGTKDYNGWLHARQYDSSGRLIYDWEPFDFPTKWDNSKGPLATCTPVTKYETIVTNVNNNIAKGLGNQGSISRGSIIYDTISNKMIVGSFNYSGSHFKAAPPMTQYKSKQIEVKSRLYYEPSPTDNFHDSSQVLSAKLTLHLEGSIAHDCKTLKLAIPSISYVSEVMVACPEVDEIGGGCTPTSAENQPMVVQFDLTPAIPTLQQSIPGTPLAMDLSMDMGTGYLEVDTKTIDHYPCIQAYISQPQTSNDFTHHYQYNDVSRVTTSYTKIDDQVITQYSGGLNPKFPHTYTGSWSQTFANNVSRYTGTAQRYGLNNTLLQSFLLIGNPLNPQRTDTINYSYSGEKTIATDGYSFEFELDGAGNLVKSSIPADVWFNPIGGTPYPIKSKVDVMTYSHDLGNPSKFNLGTSQDFYGLCIKEVKKDNNNVTVTSYYDAYKKLRRTVVDSCNGAGGCSPIITKYDYDASGNLTIVTHPDNTTTSYTYDDWGRMIRKIDNDAGTLSFAYDTLGNLRFSQTPKQRDSNEITYHEYDDLGRTTLIGEARINPAELGLNGTTVTLTDKLLPNRMNIFDNNGQQCSTCLLTVNASIWDELVTDPLDNNRIVADPATPQSYLDYTQIASSLYTTRITVNSNDLPLTTGIQPPYILHEAKYYSQVSMPNADPYKFENVYTYPEFARTVINYDEMPDKKGKVWKNFPSEAQWEMLLPRNQFTNLLGRKAAVAYRDNPSQPFHYVVFSYDARGRIEALVRYTENLGFDGVYYTYNSGNQPNSVRVVDAVNQYTIWYEYDNNGRVSKVSAKAERNAGYRHNSSMSYNDFYMPWVQTKPASADMVYFYNKRNKIDSIQYNGGSGQGGLTKLIFYNPAGWVDSLMVRKSSDTIFHQEFTRDVYGNISQQVYSTDMTTFKTETYYLDKLNELKSFTDADNNTETYDYDDMGNRNAATRNGTNVFTYTYNGTKKNRLSSVTNAQLQSRYFFYDVNGYADSVRKYDGANLTSVTKMNFGYDGILAKLKAYDVNHSLQQSYLVFPTTYNYDLTEWEYRQGPNGTREQKRMMYSPFGDSTYQYDAGHNKSFTRLQSWAYNVTGAGGGHLALYRGIQMAAFDNPATFGTLATKRRVFMAIEKYYAGELQLDGSTATFDKIYQISDAQGSVRFTYKVTGGTVDYKTYKPYGETNTGTTERFGWEENEIDPESGLMNMGARMYMPEIGRFLAPDPMADAFSTVTPYCYALNNPVSYGDPSGMAPTKNEKYGDKLLYFDDLSDVWDEYQSIERSSAEGRTMSRAIEDEMDAMVTRLGLSNGWLAIVGNKIVDAHGSEKYAYDNYDNKRTGGDGNANNGQGDNQATNSSNSGTANTLTNEQKQEVQSHIHIQFYGDVKDKEKKEQAFWDNFWKANSKMTAKQLEYYTSYDFCVGILSDKEWESYTKSQHGSPLEMGRTNTGSLADFGIISIAYSDRIFEPNYLETHELYYGNELLDLPSTIQHEFGHGYARFINGGEYNSFQAPYLENWPIWYVNQTYRIPAGLPAQSYNGNFWTDLGNALSNFFWGTNKHTIGHNP